MSNDNSNSSNNNDTNSLLSVDQLKTYVEDLFVSFSSVMNERFQDIEEKVESFEKQIATLVVGFGEQAVFLEALLSQLAFATEEEQRAFQQSVNESRKQMLKVMQDGSETLVASENEGLASAIDDVVNSKSSDI
jgi:hypothetical protein